MIGEKYKKLYVIRVLPTSDYTKWYYNKQDRTFDAVIHYKGKKPYFVIDHLHKIPTEDASIVEIKREIKYVKY